MSDYKRLTKWEIPNCASVNGCSPIDKDIANAINRLAELEDKIENGTLVELPCKKGDIVYHIDRYWQSPIIEEYEVYGFTMNDKNELRILVAYGMFCMSKDEIFLTKAEAEAELAKLRGRQ